MIQVTVSDDVARAVAGPRSLVVLVDSQGKQIGQFQRIASASDRDQINADVALAMKRMEAAKQGGTFFTTDQVIGHLQQPK